MAIDISESDFIGLLNNKLHKLHPDAVIIRDNKQQLIYEQLDTVIKAYGNIPIFIISNSCLIMNNCTSFCLPGHSNYSFTFEQVGSYKLESQNYFHRIYLFSLIYYPMD